MPTRVYDELANCENALAEALLIVEHADWFVQCRDQYVLCRMQGGKCKEPSDSMDRAYKNLVYALAGEWHNIDKLSN